MVDSLKFVFIFFKGMQMYLYLDVQKFCIVFRSNKYTIHIRYIYCALDIL